jgi:hypothetical protein
MARGPAEPCEYLAYDGVYRDMQYLSNRWAGRRDLFHAMLAQADHVAPGSRLFTEPSLQSAVTTIVKTALAQCDDPRRGPPCGALRFHLIKSEKKNAQRLVGGGGGGVLEYVPPGPVFYFDSARLRLRQPFAYTHLLLRATDAMAVPLRGMLGAEHYHPTQ